jgi:cytidyltransferase-like protein
MSDNVPTRRPYHLAAIHGRFQPFHLGHWAYLQEALEVADQVIVGITSPLLLETPAVEAPDDQRHLRSNNPFTYFERAEFILSTLSGAGMQYANRVVIVPFDVSGPADLWPQVIPLDALMLVTPHEPWDEEKGRRFKEAGYRVEFLPTRQGRITATYVRSLILRDLDDWRSLVPNGTTQAIERLALDKRLRNGVKNDSIS